jgi:hypothetical protein
MAIAGTIIALSAILCAPESTPQRGSENPLQDGRENTLQPAAPTGTRKFVPDRLEFGPVTTSPN